MSMCGRVGVMNEVEETTKPVKVTLSKMLQESTPQELERQQRVAVHRRKRQVRMWKQ